MLHRPRQHRASAGLFLFRGGARPTLSGKAAHQGRCAADGGQLRQTAGATAAADAIKVSPRASRRDAAICPQLGVKRKSLALSRNDVNVPYRRFVTRLRCGAAREARSFFEFKCSCRSGRERGERRVDHPYRPSTLPCIVASAHDDRDARKETISQPGRDP